MKLALINSRLFSGAALLAIATIASAGSLAQAADPVYTCHTNKQRLEIYQTKTGFLGQLTDLYGGVSLNCEQAPTAQVWACVEAREGAGRVTVQVNGAIQQVTVSREPVNSPSAPQGQPITQTLNCL